METSDVRGDSEKHRAPVATDEKSGNATTAQEADWREHVIAHSSELSYFAQSDFYAQVHICLLGHSIMLCIAGEHSGRTRRE